MEQVKRHVTNQSTRASIATPVSEALYQNALNVRFWPKLTIHENSPFSKERTILVLPTSPITSCNGPAVFALVGPLIHMHLYRLSGAFIPDAR